MQLREFTVMDEARGAAFADAPATVWRCAQTKPRRESFARLHLERQGVEVFLPMVRAKQVRGDDVSWKVEPLFPRYLFFRFAEGVSLRPVSSTLGVSSVVAFGGSPADVPDAVVEGIRGRCVDEVLELEDPELRPGDAVRILAGPYRGMDAIFHRHTTKEERVVILLDFMASVAQVKIDRRFLEPEDRRA